MMKISVVKIGDKFAVRIKPFIGKASFLASKDSYEYDNPIRVLEYCLFNTQDEANMRADMLRAVK